MKKGQITFFLILGVIIVIAAFFMFYFSGQAREETSQATTEEAAKELFSSTRVKAFVTQCLSRSLDEGLEVLGRQSGYITRECKGNVFEVFPTPLYDLTIQPKNLFYDSTQNKCNESLNYSVTYLIRKNRIHPAHYPSENFTETGESTGNYGRSSLPDLRDSDFSWEVQLDNFVKANVEDCLDFTDFQEGVTAGNVTVQTSINEFDVTSNLNVTVVIEGTPLAELTDFKVTKRIRLNSLHEFVNELISKDNSFLSFNMARDYEDLASWKHGFSLQLTEVSDTTDIVVVNDSLSSLYAQDYTFVFARENRPPVVSFIEDQDVLSSITVPVFTFDPDEDALTESVIWDPLSSGLLHPNGRLSPAPVNCTGSDCFANITIFDPQGLNDSQRFKVFIPN